MQKMIKIAVLMGLIAAGQLEAMQSTYQPHSYLVLRAADEEIAKEHYIPYQSGLLFGNDTSQSVALPIENKDMRTFIERLRQDLEHTTACYPSTISGDGRRPMQYCSYKEIAQLKVSLRDRIGRGKWRAAQANPPLSQGFPEEPYFLYEAPHLIRALNAVTGPLPVPELKGFYGYRFAEVLANSRAVSTLVKEASGMQKLTAIIGMLSNDSARAVYEDMLTIKSVHTQETIAEISSALLNQATKQESLVTEIGMSEWCG